LSLGRWIESFAGLAKYPSLLDVFNVEDVAVLDLRLKNSYSFIIEANET
jgi:hypothetical protein